MKKILLCITVALFLLGSLGTAQAVIGIPDRVPGSTLIVPMFEVGIDEVANPHDTYAIVWTRFGPTTVHWVIWDVNGHPVMQGNFVLEFAATNPLSLRLMLNPAPQAVKDQLTDGDFYRGFMTFDEVTSATSLLPINALYPFASANSLEGFIYYVRLTQGSTNGMSMLPLEAVPSSVSTDGHLYGFYQAGDDREEIDADARHHAQALSALQAAPDPGQIISRIHNRIYTVSGTNGFTKLVVFAYPEGSSGCFGDPECGPGTVAARWYNEAGTVLFDSTLDLTHMVNIIPVFTLSGNASGMLSIFDFPNGWEVFAFTINSASPNFNPNLSWDAIFESFFLP